MNNKTETKTTDNGVVNKTAGKFSFSLSAKNTTPQPKPESDVIKNPQPISDAASLLASLKAEKINKSDDDSTKDVNLKPIKLKLVASNSKLAGTKRPAQEAKKINLAEIFNPDEQGDDEEMPPEAKMRMRNIGKDTPTASGPNSFNKGKLGFCNQAKMLEKQMKLAFEEGDRSKRK